MRRARLRAAVPDQEALPEAVELATEWGHASRSNAPQSSTYNGNCSPLGTAGGPTVDTTKVTEVTLKVAEPTSMAELQEKLRSVSLQIADYRKQCTGYGRDFPNKPGRAAIVKRVS